MDNNYINNLCIECHDMAVEKGFYERKRDIPELLMLIVSELSEAMEEDRNLVINKDKFNIEIADTFIRLFDLCGFLNIDIEKYINQKIELNKKRPYKHNKRY